MPGNVDQVAVDQHAAFVWAPGTPYSGQTVPDGLVFGPARPIQRYPETTPQTIAVFPQWTCVPVAPCFDAMHPYSPLGTPFADEYGSPTESTSSSRRLFRFGANDPTGPGNLVTIQGFVSQALPDTTFGGPLPSTTGCHFIYHVGTGAIDLMSPDNSVITDSGILGGQGSIRNFGSQSTCTVYLPQSKQVVIGNNVELVLDLEILQIGTWYLYEIAQNPSGQTSSNRQLPSWSTWGFWQILPITP